MGKRKELEEITVRTLRSLVPSELWRGTAREGHRVYSQGERQEGPARSWGSWAGGAAGSRESRSAGNPCHTPFTLFGLFTRVNERPFQKAA